MRKVKGRLIFDKKSNGQIKPIANAKLQLWDLDVIKNDFLSDGATDAKGDFEISYDPKKAGDRWNDVPDLVLRFLDREFTYDKRGRAISNWFIVKNFHAGNNINDAVFDFGTLKVAFWEYEDKEALDKVSFTPRVATIDGKTPQCQRFGRTSEQIQVGLKHYATHKKDSLIAKFSEEFPSNSQIEEDYPLNKTRKLKEAARSDEFLSDLVLNGFNPCLLKKGNEDNSYFIDFAWNGLELDGKHFAPNTTANFQLVNDKLKLTGIALQKRIGGEKSAHAGYRAPKDYAPNDPEWERVKRIFRCNYFLFGEVNTHLSKTHLNIEQYIVPIRRNLLQNPIASLLLPHFFGTTAVNLAANDILLATDGLVQKCSALTENSVKKMCQESFGTLNWYGWKPRKAICEDHNFAKIGLLYWDVLENYVTRFVNKKMLGITKYWKEIRAMSEELVFNSLPFIPSHENLFYDNGEVNTINKIHPFLNGKVSAISPVTMRETPDNEDIQNLIQFCCYLLFHSTFLHSWLNDLQYDMGGEIEFATLGITDDISNLRVDETTVVPPTEALEHPFICYILNYTKYGYIMRNEDDDMHPQLIKHLLDRKNDFGALDFDIRGVRSCINV